ncbi:MAG: MATE family efflux transporter [Candidatus Ornithospirochaeta sp.]|nr:MATE family efflux transporter [Candidatus Ornithospirochaeta sp.]
MPVSMVIFIGIFAQFFYNLICSLLRSLGDSETPLIFLLFSTVLNIGLDLLFIVYFRLGVIGAAAATATAQAASAIMCLIYAFWKYPELHLSGKDFRFDPSLYIKHLMQGIPMGLQFSVLAIGIIVMQRALVAFDLGADGVMVAGNPAQNGFGAANKLNYFLMCPLSALGTAIVSFNAQNLGAGRQDRIRRATLKCLMIGTAMCLVLGCIGMLMTINGAYQHVFMSLEKISSQSIHYGNIYLYVDLALYFLLMLLYVLRSGVQGVGQSEFTLLAGCAELVARTAICAFLPSIVNGGPIDSSASVGAYIALCLGDPGAWILAIATLLYPTARYLFGVSPRKICRIEKKRQRKTMMNQDH